MKLLLISLQSNASLVGIKYIAATARSNGYDSKILLVPGYLERELHPVLEGFIKDYNPDLIGISLMSIEFYPAKNMTRLIKEKFDVPVIWGGLHVILKPEECIHYADYVCSGEFPISGLMTRAILLKRKHCRRPTLTAFLILNTFRITFMDFIKERYITSLKTTASSAHMLCMAVPAI